LELSLRSTHTLLLLFHFALLVFFLLSFFGILRVCVVRYGIDRCLGQGGESI
jgi:hypothetical protein